MESLWNGYLKKGGEQKVEQAQPMFDVNRVMQVMSEILSDKYGLEITLRAIPKSKEGGHE